MSMDEDLVPRKRSFEPRNLEPLSIEELNEYIGELEAEIARARDAIGAKQAHRGAADSIFKA